MARLKSITETGPIGLRGIRGTDLYGTLQSLSLSGNEDAIAALQALSIDKIGPYLGGDITPFYTPVEDPKGSPWTQLGQSAYDLPYIIGSNPDDIGEHRAYEQSGLLQLGNGILKGSITAGTTFLNSTLGLLYGVGLGLYNLGDDDEKTGFWQGMWDNDFNKAMSSIQEEAEKILPNYYSQYEQEAPWYNSIFTANFLGDKVLKNAGFTIGALAAAYATGGLGSLAGSGIFNIGKGIASAARFMGAGIDTATNILTVSRVGGLIANMAVRNLIGASGEGSIEAINAVKDEDKLLELNLSNRYNELVSQLNPYDPEYGAKLNAINKAVELYREEKKSQLRDIGNSVYGLNLAILSISNSLLFGSIFRGGFKHGAKLAEHTFEREGKEITGKEALLGLLRGEGFSLANQVDKGWKKTALGTVKNMFSEGSEEAALNLASNTNQMVASARLNEKARLIDKAADLTILGSRINPEATDDLTEYSKAFVKTLSDLFGGFEKPGWEEFFLGALTGGFGTPMIKKKIQRDSNGKLLRDKDGNIISKWGLGMSGGVWEAREELLNEWDENLRIIDTLNKSFQSEEFIKKAQHATALLMFNKDMELAIKDDDIFQFKNSELGAITEATLYFRDAGLIDNYKDLFRSFTNIDDETLEQLYKATITEDGTTELSKEDKEKNRQTYEEKAKSTLEKIEKILDYYDYVDEKFREHSSDFKLELAYKYILLDDTIKRRKEIEDREETPSKFGILNAKINDLLTSDYILNNYNGGITNELLYIEDNTRILTDKEKDDIEKLKQQERLLRKTIKDWEKNPNKVEAIMQMALINSKLLEQARDSKLLLELLEGAKSLSEIESIMNTLGVLDLDEANQIYLELQRLASPELRAKIMLYHYSASSRKAALDWLDRQDYFDEEDKSIFSSLLLNIWTNANLSSSEILSMLQALKLNVDNLSKDNIDLSELTKYISQDQAIDLIFDAEGFDSNSVTTVSDAIDIAIKEVKDGIREYGNWEALWNAYQLLLQQLQQLQLQRGSRLSGNLQGLQLQGGNLILNTLTVVDDWVNSNMKSNDPAFTMLTPLQYSTVISEVMDKLNWDDDRKEDKDEIESVTTILDEYIKRKKRGNTNWLNSMNAMRNAVANSVENILNPLLLQLQQQEGLLLSVDALPFMDRIKASTSKQELDDIWDEAIIAGVKEEDIIRAYTDKVSELMNQTNLHIPGTVGNRYKSNETLVDETLSLYLELIGDSAELPKLSYDELEAIANSIHNTILDIKADRKIDDKYISFAKLFYLTEDGKRYLPKETLTPLNPIESLNRGENEMTITLTPYLIDNLKNGLLVVNNYVGAYYGGINNALKVLWVIDNKLNELKDLPVHYVVHPDYNTMYAAIPYSSEVASKVSLNLGFVIVNQNLERFLIIGALGYLKGDTVGLLDWQNKKADLEAEANGFYGYYTSAEATKITNIGDGRMIDNMPNVSTTNVVELLEDISNLGTNPHNLRIGDLKWGIVYSDGIKTVHAKSGDLVHTADPIDLENDLGKVYLYIPTASGTYYRHEIKPCFYNEVNNGHLKDRIQQAIEDIINKLKQLAVIDIKSALVLEDSFFIDFIDDLNIRVRFIPRGERLQYQLISLTDKDLAITDLLNILSAVNPRIDVSIASLKIDEEVQDLAEAGALNLMSALLLGTAGANFNIALNPNVDNNSGNNNRKPLQPSRLKTVTYNGLTIEFDGTNFKRNGTTITNQLDIDNLKDIIAIENGLYLKETILDTSGKKPKELEGLYVFIPGSTGIRVYHISRGNYSRVTGHKKLPKLFQQRTDTIDYNLQQEAELKIRLETESGLYTVGETSSAEDWGLGEDEGNKDTKSTWQIPNTDLTAKVIPYDTLTWNNLTNKSESSSNKANIISMADRIIILVDINGVNMPFFYISSGHGGKQNVQAGKWYPFFGIGKDGWLNKGSEKQINNYYGSLILKTICELLDKELGDLRNDTSIPKVKATGLHIDFINQDMNPAENETATSIQDVNNNIKLTLIKIGEFTVGETSTADEWGLDKDPIIKIVKQNLLNNPKTPNAPLQGSEKTATFASLLLDNSNSVMDDICDLLDSLGANYTDTPKGIMEYLDSKNVDYSNIHTLLDIETIKEIIKNCR